jgi:hypothetical protein
MKESDSETPPPKLDDPKGRRPQRWYLKLDLNNLADLLDDMKAQGRTPAKIELVDPDASLRAPGTPDSD